LYLALDRGVVRGILRFAVQALATGQVHVELVDARHSYDRRIALRDGHDTARIVGVHSLARRQEYGVGGESWGFGPRHAGAHAELSHLVAARGDYAALARATPDDDRLADEARIEQALDGYEEGVEIQAANASDARGHIAEHNSSNRPPRPSLNSQLLQRISGVARRAT